MDFFDAARVVSTRIEKLEPEHVRKIIGHLILHDHTDQDLIRLAFGPDSLINTSINKAKIELGLLPQPTMPASLQFRPYSKPSSHPLRIPTALQAQPSYWVPPPGFEQPIVQNPDFLPYSGYKDPIPTPVLSPDDPLQSPFPNESFYGDAISAGARAGRRSLGLTDFPSKNCLYFNRGFCKHGANCRFFHGPSTDPMFSSSSSDLDDDGVFSPGSLEKLELEIVELLKSRRGGPVSIASLPLMYCEKYGKVLQAEGYLTESQRHGKAGYSLTKLLARLKNSITLIDRPHGQHSVILAEDASKYMENRRDRSDPGPIVSGSQQIYLTFPAESMFSEEDVSNYFKFHTVGSGQRPS